MRVKLNQTEGVFPMPVLMVATYNDDGSVNVMNAAWGTMQERGNVALNLTESHKTVKNIKVRKAFTVSIADAAHVVEADYFGVVSGNREPKKFENSGLTAVKAGMVDAPVINEFPLCLECEYKRREELRLEIQRIYDDSRQIFGAEKICAVMKEDGLRVSREMVAELMRDMGLISIRQEAKDLYDKEQRRFKNYLNQQFTVARPNEVWVSDVTYFRFNNKNYYICVILDLFSRMVVGYRIGKVNSTQLVRSTFQMAHEERQPVEPLIFHTDRGSNYHSKTFCTLLRSLGVTQSFSRAHIPYDNSVMESFFSNLKREELYRTKYHSEKEFRTAVDRYMVFYNEQRPHAKNGYKTPFKKELDFLNKQALLELRSN